MTRLRLFFHDHCFDGTASAALFSAFYRHRAYGDVEVLLQGLQHSVSDPYAGYELDADDVACVDFRYHPALTWWFDHHVTAFQPPSLRASYECNRQGGQLFFDPAARSCTKYLASVLEQRFGWEAPDFGDVIHWADPSMARCSTTRAPSSSSRRRRCASRPGSSTTPILRSRTG